MSAAFEPAVSPERAMGSFDAPVDVEQRIESSRGKGSPLPPHTQRRFEDFFSADLSSVRIHSGPESADMNEALYARAFTTGSDVFLGASASAADEHLMAHELTHVVQQGAAAPLEAARLAAAHPIEAARPDTSRRSAVANRTASPSRRSVDAEMAQPLVECEPTHRSERRGEPVSGDVVLQTKLAVGSAHDPAEAEADQMADAFVAMRAIAPAHIGRAALVRQAIDRTALIDRTSMVNRDETAVAAPAGSAAPPKKKAEVEGNEAAEGDAPMMEGTSVALEIATESGANEQLNDELDNPLAFEAPQGAEITAGVGGLALSVIALMESIQALYELHKAGVADESEEFLAALETVQVAGDNTRGAITVAQATGATLVATLIPGVNLAFALLSIVTEVTQIARLHHSRKKQATAIESCTDPKLKLALKKTAELAKARLAVTYIELAGSITVAVGAIGTLTGQAWGPAVSLIGGVVTLIGGVTSSVLQHKAAVATEAARAAYADEAAQGAVSEATYDARLSADAAFAVHEMLTKAVSIPHEGVETKEYADLEAVVMSLGISKKWLAEYRAGQHEIEEAEEIVLGFLGAQTDPKKIADQIKGGLVRVKDKAVKIFTKIKNFVTGSGKQAAVPAAAGA